MLRLLLLLLPWAQLLVPPLLLRAKLLLCGPALVGPPPLLPQLVTVSLASVLTSALPLVVALSGGVLVRTAWPPLEALPVLAQVQKVSVHHPASRSSRKNRRRHHLTARLCLFVARRPVTAALVQQLLHVHPRLLLQPMDLTPAVPRQLRRGSMPQQPSARLAALFLAVVHPTKVSVAVVLKMYLPDPVVRPSRVFVFLVQLMLRLLLMRMTWAQLLVLPLLLQATLLLCGQPWAAMPTLPQLVTVSLESVLMSALPLVVTLSDGVLVRTAWLPLWVQLVLAQVQKFLVHQSVNRSSRKNRRRRLLTAKLCLIVVRRPLTAVLVQQLLHVPPRLLLYGEQRPKLF